VIPSEPFYRVCGGAEGGGGNLRGTRCLGAATSGQRCVIGVVNKYNRSIALVSKFIKCNINVVVAESIPQGKQRVAVEYKTVELRVLRSERKPLQLQGLAVPCNSPRRRELSPFSGCCRPSAERALEVVREIVLPHYFADPGYVEVD
jgi:hypothetical protein